MPTMHQAPFIPRTGDTREQKKESCPHGADILVAADREEKLSGYFLKKLL